MIAIGNRVPSIELRATSGELVNLSALPGTVIVYAYPRTSPPDAPPIEGWDLIPGARGCMPQSCAFRDHFAELLAAGANHVFGLSTQSTAYQIEAALRLHLPFALLSDENLHLAAAFDLPTFEAGGMALLKRLTLILRDGIVTHVMFPIPEPVHNAEEVLKLLQSKMT